MANRSGGLRRGAQAAAGVLMCALLAACGGSAAPPAPPPVPTFAPQASYERVVDEFISWYLAENPVRATGLGVHEHDARLPSLFPGDLQRRAHALRGYLTRLGGVDRRVLEGDAYFDHRVLEYALRAELLDLEEVGVWQRDPMRYSGLVARGTATLVQRPFAPLESRMRSMIGRWGEVPALLRAARQNLDAARVPPLLVERAVDGTRGTADYLADEVPAALEAQGLARVEATLRDEWDAARRLAIASVDSFAAWLQADLGRRASGDIRLGPDLLRRVLLYREHVDIPLGELDVLNRGAIADYREWMDRVALQHDPLRHPESIVDSISASHPSAAELIPAARSMMADARDFVIAAGIVTLPSTELPTVRETPPYARTGFASMDAAGPFEASATEAYYNITNVDPGWTRAQQEQHLTYFSWDGLLGITIHEVMPGHFVQNLHEPRIPTRLRRIFMPATFTEGWAHYTEQMMLDEGFREADAGARLAQIRRALQRHARWHAVLALHASDATIEEAAEDFANIALFEPFPALRETQRAVWDPTYLHYALGRMQIFALRERMRQETGEAFELRTFHDRLLALGLPLPLAAESMLGREAAPLLVAGARTPGVPEAPRALDR